MHYEQAVLHDIRQAIICCASQRFNLEMKEIFGSDQKVVYSVKVLMKKLQNIIPVIELCRLAFLRPKHSSLHCGHSYLRC